jgi:hypothetical protein
MGTLRWLLCVLVATSTAALADGRPKLFVLDLNATGGIDPALARNLTHAATVELTRRGFFQVLSSADVETLLGVERQKQLLGCSEAAQSCITELAGAVGAELLLSGSVGRIGDAYQLTLQTLDAVRAQPIGRSVKLSKSPEALVATLPMAVAEATGIPLPAPPSRIVPIGLIAGGVAVLIAGSVLGLQAINDDGALTRELDTGASKPAVLSFSSDYDRQASRIGVERTLSLIGLIAGAALVVAGSVWLGKLDTPSGSLSAIFWGSGAAFAWSWP